MRREDVAQLLFQQVADHPAGLRAQHVQREAFACCLLGSLQREQADLWPVAMGKNNLVSFHDPGQLSGRAADVGELVVRGQRLTSAQQRVSSQGDFNSHAGVLCCISAECRDEHGLDGVHPVFGLSEDDRGI